MSVKHEVVNGLIFLTAAGTVTNADFEACFKRICVDPKCKSAKGMIIVDEFSDYAPTSKETREAARIMRAFEGSLPPRVAVVAGSDIKYGIGRMISAYSESQSVTFQVFRDATEARRWALEFVE